MVHKPSPCPPVMGAAPWRIFHHKDREIIIDVDGGISLDGNVSNPFPAEITFATICDNGLAATWVDHDLRLARMAFIPLDETLQEGVSKAKLRTHRETTMVAGSKWCHIIDAEPLALESKMTKLSLLYGQGVFTASIHLQMRFGEPLCSQRKKNRHPDLMRLLRYPLMKMKFLCGLVAVHFVKSHSLMGS